MQELPRNLALHLSATWLTMGSTMTPVPPTTSEILSGTDLRALGFNVDFAPVADVNIDPNNELGDRIFSSDPEVVANMVTNVSMGMQDAGVSATLKHFPGLGSENG